MICGGRGNGDVPARGREAQGVADQVSQYLLQAYCIGVNRGEIVRNLNADVYTIVDGHKLQFFNGIRGDFLQADEGTIQTSLTGIGA